MSALDDKKAFYNRFLLIVAGLGGLLYGIDVGIVAGALPYLEATSGFNAGQLSIVVAAVLLGSVISTLFAGMLADWMGRRLLMVLSGLMFVLSIPTIALSHGYDSLVVGRLLQGVSGGLIGVVVPLYLAECLTASDRGKGTGIFQWLLTLGLVIAASLGLYFSFRVDQVAKLGDAIQLFAFKDKAWRGIFWVSLPPGVLFVLGSMMVAESPRWLLRRGKQDPAYAALLRSRTTQQADVELREMQEVLAAEKKNAAVGAKSSESLLRRKYVIPFVLACVILACNQATGINSIIGYNTNILLQSGLSDFAAHWGYLIFQIINFLVTLCGVMLVDRKGRKFLLSIGTGGIIVSMVCTGLLFVGNEKHGVDARAAVQSKVSDDQKLSLTYNAHVADQLLKQSGKEAINRPTSLVVIYSYGDFRATSQVVRSNDAATKPIERHARCLRSRQQSRRLLFESVREPGCGASGTADHRKSVDQSCPRLTQRLDRRHHAIYLYGVLCRRPRSVRLAGTLGVDADAHPFERDEHCLINQSGRRHVHRCYLSSHRRQIRIFDHVLRVCRLHVDLLHHGNLVLAGDEGENAGRN